MPLFQTDPTWTPADHRAALAKWQETAPANDEDIFRPFRKPAKPSAKHVELADYRRAIWLWRHLTTTTEAANGGAWIGQAANDNQKDDDQQHPTYETLDQGFDAEPSVDDLLACVGTGVVDRVVTITTRKPKVRHVSEAFPDGIELGGWTETRTAEIQALSTDIETTPTIQYAWTWDENYIYGRRYWKQMPRVVRWGGLMFYRYPAQHRHDARDHGLDGSLFKYRKPGRTHWTRAQDKYRESKSTVRVSGPRNDVWSAMFNKAVVRWVKPTKVEAVEPMTPEAWEAFWKENAALHGTTPFDAARDAHNLPQAEKAPVGLPCGSRRVSDSFIGCKPAPGGGKGGAPSFETVADLSVSIEEARAAASSIGADNVLALDTALTATTMGAIGQAFGKTGKHAERYGKKKLLEASSALNTFFRDYGFFRAA